MPRGRKKKYVRPTIECECDTCGKDLTQPYIHIELVRTGFITSTPIEEGTKTEIYQVLKLVIIVILNVTRSQQYNGKNKLVTGSNL